MTALLPRQSAIAAGLKRYFTGKPCPHGHVAERRVSSFACLQCETKWQKENVERCRAIRRKWEIDNPEKARASARKCYRNNPETARAKTHRRLALRHKAEGSHTAEDIASIRRLQKNRCAYCAQKLPKNFHVDHIVALAMGGSNSRRNLQVTCPRCNSRKSAKDPIVFAQSLGRLL